MPGIKQPQRPDQSLPGAKEDPEPSRCLQVPALLSIVVAILVLTGCCSRPAASSLLTIEHQISPQPVQVGPATIVLKLTGADGKPVGKALVKLEANMSHPGMKPEFSQAQELEPGRYQARLEFTMAGDWVILVRTTLETGEEIERQITVHGVQPK